MSGDPAKARFIAITAMRFVGAGLVILGLLTVKGRLDLPAEVGYALVLFGLVDVFLVPTLLARRWRSRP